MAHKLYVIDLRDMDSDASIHSFETEQEARAFNAQLPRDFDAVPENVWNALCSGADISLINELNKASLLL